MNLVRLIDFFRNRLKAVKIAAFVLLGLLIVIDALPFLVDKHHAHTAPEHIPGFWSVFGFVACALIIVLSKAYGHLKVGRKTEIMTREDYYND